MISIDPERLDLVEEYHRQPFGPHSAELQRLLKILRWDRPEDRYIIVQPRVGGPWHVAKQTGLKGSPVMAVHGESYDRLDEAWCALFRKRWTTHTGRGLILGEDGIRSVDAGMAPEALFEVRAERPLLGYADRFSVRPGDKIGVKVSSELEGEYRAALVRIRCADGTPDGAGYKDIETLAAFEGAYPARFQPIRVGSYAEIANPEPFHLHTFCLQAYVWPTTPGRGEQALLGTWDASAQAGYALVLDKHGALTLLFGDGQQQVRISTHVPLLARQWYLVAGSFDAATGEACVVQRPLRLYGRDDSLGQGRATTNFTLGVGGQFRIAAWHDADEHGARPGGNFNGKIESPSVAARAMRSSEIDALLAHARAIDCGAEVIAQWDFSREIPSTYIVDVSGHGRHGRTVNLPTRAMKGWQWDGTEYNWTHAPDHYGAIHFHDDDLYDCGWETDFVFTIPEDLSSGIYAVRLRQDKHEEYVPFVVSPPAGKPTAPLALLLPTASYWAYANFLLDFEWAEMENVTGNPATAGATPLFLFQNPVFGPSLYDHHSDGSGVCYASRLRPMLNIRPKEAFLWQFPADTHITDWLEAKGIPYDVLTEDDLDAEGAALLAPYKCVLTGTHPEYPSRRILEALERYKAGGGRFVYLGGNGFYWRTSYHPELPGVIEMRRAEDGIRSWAAEGGEYYHSFTGELGGMWRRMGQAPQSVAGTGMTAQGFDFSTYYQRTPASFDARASFIFEGIGSEERIGDFGIIGGGAAGWEIDRADPALGTPPHALIVATASNFSSSYHWMKEEMSHTHSAITGETCPLVRCDMVFYETPNGGAVFATSSIAWSGALAHQNYQNNVSRITENVVRRFLNPRSFE
jgi:N,N-dimethylformamidase